jgi:uncharacterized protein (UPF0332 family)
MTPEQEQRIQFRLKRSEDTLREAKVLAELKSWNGVVNRLYYAAFYAISALLEKEHIHVKTHSSQKSSFNEKFLLSGRLNKEVGGVYNLLFNYRQNGDYNDFADYEAEEIEPMILKTEHLITEIKKLI